VRHPATLLIGYLAYLISLGAHIQKQHVCATRIHREDACDGATPMCLLAPIRFSL